MAEQREKARKIYSTEIIERLIADKASGYEIDWGPFYSRDLELRAPNITFNMTQEEVDEYMKCYNDPLYFIETYCKFKDETGGEPTLVKLRDYQKKVITTVTDEVYNEKYDVMVPKNKNVIYMASRQVGKTTTICSILAYKMIFNASYNALVVANKEDTAKEIVDKLTTIIRGLPFFLKPGCDNFGKTGLRFDNGSRLSSSATTGTASIGYTINFVLLDEFAHVPENIVNSFWRSIYPTLSSSVISQCVILSTPNGTTNKFYEIWNGSILGKNSFVHLRTDYWEVPGRDDAWVAQQKADFGEEEFAQEFALQFNKNSSMLMKTADMEFLNRFVVDYVHKPIAINNQFLNDERLVWNPKFDPNNIDPTDKFVFLVDIAEGIDPEELKSSKKKDPDFNSINIFRLRLNSVANLRKYSNKSCGVTDCFRFEQVGRWSSNTDDEIYAAKVASTLAYNLFNDDLNDSVRIIVEMNFNGKSFYDTFRRHVRFTGSTVLKTYHRKPVPGERQKKQAGIKTTKEKGTYCVKGNRMISKRRIIVSCSKTFEQMKAFGYVKGKLKGISSHDDLSMPVFHHIPRILEEDNFKEWLEEYLYSHPNKALVYRLNEYIQKWIMENPDMTDDEFKELYGVGETNTFGMDPRLSDPTYSNINPYFLQAAQPSLSPYSEGFSRSPYQTNVYGIGR